MSVEQFSKSKAESQNAETAQTAIEQARKAAMARLAGRSFTTEKGSRYVYDEQGRTARFKKAEGKQYEWQDITVFADLDDADARLFLDSIHSDNDDPAKKKKVYVVERMPDNQPKVIRKFTDVTDPNRLYLAVAQNGKMIASRKATLSPTKGFTVFDTRQFQEGDKVITERHLGHKVIEIQ